MSDRPGEPALTPADLCWPRMQMLCIDPARCLDCGLCVDRCPAGAIYAEHDLPAEWWLYTLINAAFFRLRAPAHRPP